MRELVEAAPDFRSKSKTFALARRGSREAHRQQGRGVPNSTAVAATFQPARRGAEGLARAISGRNRKGFGYRPSHKVRGRPYRQDDILLGL